LADVAYSLQVGRGQFAHRRMVVCQSREEALEALERRDGRRVFSRAQEPQQYSVVFMLPGQGAQYAGMGVDLYEEEGVYREQVDRCAELLKPQLGVDLRELLYPAPDRLEESAERLKQTEFTQPALFATEYALAQLWLSWGVRPQAMIGHSLGEYVAACIAGVFSLEDALFLVAQRGKMIQKLPGGAMLSVRLPENELRPLLCDELSLAAINAPTLCVVAGPSEAVEHLEGQLTEKNVNFNRLHTSHAFHSKLMEPMLEPFAEQMGKICLKPPEIPYISNVTGTWITAEEATDPGYWLKHLRQTVRFAEGIHELSKTPRQVLLEVGPGQALGTLAKQHQDVAAQQLVFSSLRRPRDQHSNTELMLTNLGRLWLAGVNIDWTVFHEGRPRYRLSLPTYPFERRRYWVTPSPALLKNTTVAMGVEDEPMAEDSDDYSPAAQYSRPNLLNNYVAPNTEIECKIAAVWQEVLGVEQVGVHDNFYDLGGHSLLGTQLVSRLREVFPVEMPLHDFFDALTIAELAEKIEELLVEKIEELPEEEVKRLLAK
ncbi:MAG: acyltransferase domain-containing protein, partial [Ktedonobacteraceae bacterium]